MGLTRGQASSEVNNGDEPFSLESTCTTLARLLLERFEQHLLTPNRAPRQAKNSIPLSGTVRILELLMIPRVTQRQVFGENPTLSWVKAQGS